MPLPGSHLILVGRASDAIGARALGWILRDTILILTPGPVAIPAFLFRWPLEGTVRDTALQHGLGALNIDSCRVSGDMSEFFSKTTGKPRSGLGHAHGYGMGDGFGGDRANPPHHGGRWPPNLLLVHGAGCAPKGTKKIPTTGGSAPAVVRASAGYKGPSMGRHSHKEGDVRISHRDSGLETVPAWDCQPDCPARLLDEQSGDCRSAQGGACQSETRQGKGAMFGTLKPNGHQSTTYFDAGAASRFFPQFGSLPEALDWLTRLIRFPESCSSTCVPR